MKATYTQWTVFKSCPFWYNSLYVKKERTRQQSEALDRGVRVHEGLEAFVKGETDELPAEVHPSWRGTLEILRTMDDAVKSEVKISNDIAYGKFDILIDGNDPVVMDFKTGKNRKLEIEVREQLRFYTWLLGKDATTKLLWVEHPEDKATLTLQVRFSKVLDNVWRRRIDKMQSGDKTKTPNWKCRYCPVAYCEHNENEDIHDGK